MSPEVSTLRMRWLSDGRPIVLVLDNPAQVTISCGMVDEDRTGRLTCPMEAMKKYGPYVWRRFKSRLKVRLLILGTILAVYLLIRFSLGGL